VESEEREGSGESGGGRTISSTRNPGEGTELVGLEVSGRGGQASGDAAVCWG